MIMWVDIETIPRDAYPDPSLVKVPATYKDPEKIEQYKFEKAEDAWKKQALNSLQGQILCIGYAIDDAEPVCLGAWDGSEEEILIAFEKVVESVWFRWGGFNIRNFDLQWLYHRAVKYELSALSAGIPRQRYTDNVVDIYEDWAGAERSTEGYTLDNIARFLGLGGKSGSGADVLPMYLAGRYEAIAEYCKNDIRLTREIARKIDKWF